MNVRSPSRIVLLCLAAVLASCGSSGSSGSVATAPGGMSCPPSAFFDGEIRMTTRWSAATDETPDVRVIASEQGRLSCWFEGSGGRREGIVRESEWRSIWARLELVSPWASPPPTVKPQDPTGGPYHLIQMRAGNQLSQFSSQHRADLLVFTSREAADRLQYSNAIVDFVAARARYTIVPESQPAATTP